MIITGRSSQTWLAFKPAVKSLMALAVFLLYILFAAATIREAEWRNEALNDEMDKDHIITVTQLRFQLVEDVNQILLSNQSNSTEAEIKHLLDVYHNASYLPLPEATTTDVGFKIMVTDDNGQQLWSYERSLTFILTTFTLIGYGDIVPLTDGGRLTIVWLTAFGAVIMLLVMSSASTALSRILTAIYIAVAKHCFGYHWPESLEHLKLATNEHANDMHLIAARFRFIIRKDVNTFVISLIFMAFGMTIGALVMKLQEEWDWMTAYYFTFQSFTTIGFGDVMPQRFASKEFTIWYTIFFFAWVICGLSVVSMVIGFGISIFRAVTTTANSLTPFNDIRSTLDQEATNYDGDGKELISEGDVVLKSHQYIP